MSRTPPREPGHLRPDSGPLPIDDILPKLVEAVRSRPAVILRAPPGAGKTTRVPLALLDLFPPGRRLVMLEPRRLAAVNAALWMAGLLGEEIGGTVGYAIRFESRFSAATRLLVVTEGILTRRLQSDPSLEGVSLVILDEFHERSLQADLALALLLDLQRHLRPDLRLLIMSATLDPGPLAALLGGAPVVSSEGRLHPVEVRWLESDPRERLPARVSRAVARALGETGGDILAFLPGAGEIRACADILAASPEVRERGASIRPLYGDLPFREQEAAILPGPARRVVLSTNIAETSLTIEGVGVVIDSGFSRRLQHDPATGMNRLLTVRASRSSADQRAGRAGRLGPGLCWRLYGRHTYEAMTAFPPPEILIADLSSLVLDLALWGVKDPAILPWLDPPPAAAVAAARDLLRELGALDGAGEVTPLGRRMAGLPLHPRLARLLLAAADSGQPALGADLAALLSERDVLRRAPGGRAAHAGDSDIADRLEALAGFRRDRDAPPGADREALRAADRVSEQLLRLIHGGGRGRQPGEHPPGELARLLLLAWPDRLARRRTPGDERYLLAGGRGARLSPASSVRNADFLVAVSIDAGGAAEGIIHLASAVEEPVARQALPGRIERRRSLAWNGREGRLTASEEERLGAITLSSRPFSPPDAEAVPVICAAIRAEPGLITFGEAARQFQGRVHLLAVLFPQDGWPDLSDERLLAAPEEWLAPFIKGLRTARELAALEITAALSGTLTSRQRKLLDKLAPARIQVPSGRLAPLDYAAGESPVLAIKLQELFGLADSPAVAGGRAKVLLHLLSPAGRPIQVTRDLRGFWDGAYREVKKELKGRYPKHPWPDDPWSAAPTRGVKGHRGK